MGTRWLLARRAEPLGDSALLPSVAIIGSALLYADLPSRFVVGSAAAAFSVVRWLIPGLTVLLLAALLATVPGGRLVKSLGWHQHQVRLTRRWLSLLAIAVGQSAMSLALAVMVVARAVNILK